MRLILALSLAFLCGSFVGKLVQADLNLRSFCGEKGIKISRLSQIRRLTSQLSDKDFDGVCSDHVKTVLRQLDDLVKDKNACSVNKANEIVNFYEEHIKEAVRQREVAADADDGQQALKVGVNSQEDGDKKLPKALVDFVLAYGLKVSALCRNHLMGYFLPYVKELIRTRDLEDIQFLIGTDSPIDRLLRSFAKPDEILLPVDINNAVQGTNQEQLYIRDGGAKELSRVKELCERRFQPMYEETLKPIAILARSGFGFRSFLTKVGPKVAPHLHKDVFKWTKIVFLCESMKTIDIVQDSTESCKINLKTTSEGGEEVDKTVTKSMEEEEHVKGRKIKKLESYQPKIEIPDKIIGKSDLHLKKSVDSFDVTKTSVQRLEKKIAERALQILWEKSKNGMHLEALKGIWANINSCKNEPDLDKLKAELIELMQSEDSSLLHSFFRGFKMVPYSLYTLLFYPVSLLLIVPALLFVNENKGGQLFNLYDSGMTRYS